MKAILFLLLLSLALTAVEADHDFLARFARRFLDSETTDDVDNKKREKIVKHYATRSSTNITSRDPIIGEDGGRYTRKSINGSVYIIEEVDMDRRRFERKLGGGKKEPQRKLQGGPVPFPTTGAELVKNDNVISFREDTESINVEAFVFTHAEHGFEVTQGIRVEDGVAYVQMGGFALGEWSWAVRNADGSKKSTPQTFTMVEPEEELIVVRYSSSTRSGSKTTTNDGNRVGEAEWTLQGQIQGVTGRIYFTSTDPQTGELEDFACTGTAIKDNKSGRSLILTAAHCVWDDIWEQFGDNVIFIPNRDAINATLTGEDIGRQCTQDVCGCWTISAGFVHDKWRDEPWPNRVQYDYGIWVVDDEGAHTGKSCGSDALDEAVEEMEFEVGVDLTDQFVYGFGYSLEHNPDFRYCSDTTGFKDVTKGVPTYWLDGCGLTGGSSGGPWICNFDQTTGKGNICSVNSWSYTTKSGMGGPIIDRDGARCLVNAARKADFDAIEAKPDGEEGVFVNCYDRPCIPIDESGAGDEDEVRKLLEDGRVLCSTDHKN